MKKRNTLRDNDLTARITRLMSGDLQVEDVARLYTGKRSASYGRTSFREIADFVAHPDLRNRGPVADRIRDMRTTFKPLFDRSLKKENPSLNDILARAESNFRMATDEQIARLSNGRKRQQVQQILRSAVNKLLDGKVDALTEDEQIIAVRFGDRMIWNPALRSQEVFDDFKYVMVKNGLLEKTESHELEAVRSLIVLHAISVMHGTAFDLGDGITGELQAGFNNQQGCLEITATPKLEGYPKAIFMKVGLFWTDLQGKDHVDPTLMDNDGPWTFPIEIKEALITPLGGITTKECQSEDIKVIRIGGNQRESDK